MKKSTICLLLVLGGLLVVSNSAMAITTRPPRPLPPTAPPVPTAEPVVSAD